MWKFLRGRRSVYERTADGRERIVLERRHSYDGSHHGSQHYSTRRRPQSSRGMASDSGDRDGRWERGHYQALIAENEGLRQDNGRLLRDYQTVQRRLRDVTSERDRLASQNQTRALRANAIRQLEDGLQAEQDARRRAEKKLRDEKIITERKEKELLTQMRRLRSEEETWRTRVTAMTREIQEYITLNREKAARIRSLEEWMRRQGVVPVPLR